MTKRKIRGITLVELSVVISILALIALITWGSFSSLNQSQILDKEASNVLTILQRARNLTLASKDASQYGVYFDTDKVVIFKGDEYDPVSLDNEVVSLHPETRVESLDLAGGSEYVVFARLTGVTAQSGTTTLSLVKSPSTIKNIVIFSTGLAEIK